MCHLEIDMVRGAIEGWNLAELDFLFIENVGNLVCPGDFDLGEDVRVLLLSTTEGEDKPLKYPTCWLRPMSSSSTNWTSPPPSNAMWHCWNTTSIRCDRAYPSSSCRPKPVPAVTLAGVLARAIHSQSRVRCTNFLSPCALWKRSKRR